MGVARPPGAGGHPAPRPRHRRPRPPCGDDLLAAPHRPGRRPGPARAAGPGPLRAQRLDPRRRGGGHRAAPPLPRLGRARRGALPVPRRSRHPGHHRRPAARRGGPLRHRPRRAAARRPAHGPGIGASSSRIMGGMSESRSPRIVLVRHGETEWSRDGRHTGRADIPLTDRGREEARTLRAALAGFRFARVLVSPLQRARETCALAGLGEHAEPCPDLMEWDYGDDEGLTYAEIRERRPEWVPWRDGCPGGETTDGDVALFSHGHLLRVLGSRSIEQPAAFGAHLMLDTAAVSVLSAERGITALERWNDAGHLAAEQRPA